MVVSFFNDGNLSKKYDFIAILSHIVLTEEIHMKNSGKNFQQRGHEE